jgi:hypothetical protein
VIQLPVILDDNRESICGSPRDPEGWRIIIPDPNSRRTFELPLCSVFFDAKNFPREGGSRSIDSTARPGRVGRTRTCYFRSFAFVLRRKKTSIFSRRWVMCINVFPVSQQVTYTLYLLRCSTALSIRVRDDTTTSTSDALHRSKQIRFQALQINSAANPQCYSETVTWVLQLLINS